MFYPKNLPTWERLVRVLAAVAMGSCAAYYWGTLVGYVWAASGIMMALTSVVGFCPICALAGRSIAARNKMLKQNPG